MTVATEGEILKRLAEWEAKEGRLPKSLDFYRRLVVVQHQARSRVGIPKLYLSEETISHRLDGGSPLLRFEEIQIDWALLQDIFKDVVTLCLSYPEVWGEAPECLINSASSPVFLEQASRALFAENQLPSCIEPGDGNKNILEFALQAALKPFLLNHCQTMFSFVNQEKWRRGYCPICGGSPDFAFLDKENGARWLLCSRCDAEWLFQRLECPGCGTKEAGALTYFTDDEELYRLCVCEHCGCYLKTIDLRRAKKEVLLPLQRLLTLDLDIQAHNDGYHPCIRVGKLKEGVESS